MTPNKYPIEIFECVPRKAGKLLYVLLPSIGAQLCSRLGPPKIDTRYQDKPLCLSCTPVAELSSIWSGQIILPYDIPYDVISMRLKSRMSEVKNLALNENMSWILKGGCRAIQNDKIIRHFRYFIGRIKCIRKIVIFMSEYLFSNK